MIIFKLADEISLFISKQKRLGRQIGFVPTMGALHDGHLSLIKASRIDNDLTVCSIFVNPSQFNNPDDFKHYPITIEKDIEMLIEAGCDILFLPPVQEIYPPFYQKKVYELGRLENILEGFHRPGHFQGVCQVVDRLTQIIEPQKVYLGQKDYQQCMVIQKLFTLSKKQEQYELVIMPTVREKDGLAMSSRNLRLSSDDRQKAAFIYKTLNYLKDNFGKHPIDNLINSATGMLQNNGFLVDYVAIVDGQMLEAVSPDSKQVVGLIAASIGSVRLIDNLLLN